MTYGQGAIGLSPWYGDPTAAAAAAGAGARRTFCWPGCGGWRGGCRLPSLRAALGVASACEKKLWYMHMFLKPLCAQQSATETQLRAPIVVGRATCQGCAGSARTRWRRASPHASRRRSNGPPPSWTLVRALSICCDQQVRRRYRRRGFCPKPVETNGTGSARSCKRCARSSASSHFGRPAGPALRRSRPAEACRLLGKSSTRRRCRSRSSSMPAITISPRRRRRAPPRTRDCRAHPGRASKCGGATASASRSRRAWRGVAPPSPRVPLMPRVPLTPRPRPACRRCGRVGAAVRLRVAGSTARSSQAVIASECF